MRASLFPTGMTSAILRGLTFEYSGYQKRSRGVAIDGCNVINDELILHACSTGKARMWPPLS